MNTKFSKAIFPSILVLFALVIIFEAYVPGKWLSGWDTLHPEMNLSLYWGRITNSVWQEHQGLGAVASQAHASEIPRIIIVALIDMFFPTSFVRWAYFALMLILGPLGVYFLSLFLFKGAGNKRPYAFLAGLFYLLNLGTLQHFSVPLEMFGTLYAFLGWLFLYAIKYLNDRSLKTLIIWILLNVFAAPMAHTPTLWVVYMFLLGVFLFFDFLLNHKYGWKETIKDSFILFMSALVVNLYWFLPTVYFTLNHADEVSNAKITRLVSEEGILHNKQYANIKDISIIKGYLFNWRVHIGEEKFDGIFSDWESYYSQNNLELLGYFFFIIILIGGFSAFFKSRKTHFVFALMALVTMFFLLMDSKPFGFIFVFLQENISLFKEALRFPFTKFSIHLMLSYSVLFGYGCYSLSKVYLIRKSKYTSTVLTILISLLLVIYMLPAFKGLLISDIEKVSFPKQYDQVFKYLNEYSDTRIATLPVPSMFGWTYYDWIPNDIVDASYQGAGFTWFLSENPILEREFDRWYPSNEDYYNEMHYAIYSKNVDALEEVLYKYDVGFIIVDESIRTPALSKNLYFDEIKQLFAESDLIKFDREYGDIKIYRFGELKNNGYISTPSKFSKVSSSYSNSYRDASLMGSSNSPYVLDDVGYFHFTDDVLLANDATDSTLQIDLEQGHDYTVKLPDLSGAESVPASLKIQNAILNIKYLIPSIIAKNGERLSQIPVTDSLLIDDSEEIMFNGKYVNQGFEKTVLVKNKNNSIVLFNGVPAKTYNYSEQIYSAASNDCLGGEGVYGKGYGIYPDSVVVKAINKNTCLDFSSPIKVLDPGIYRVSFEYKSTEGSRPLYCLYGTNLGECLNSKYINAPETSPGEFVSYEDHIVINNPQDIKFTIILETDNKETEQEAIFKNITITAYDITESIDYDIGEELFSMGGSFNVESHDLPIRIELPNYMDLNSINSPGETVFNLNPKNCDNFNIGEYERELNNGFYEYRSKNAISCDNLNLNTLDKLSDYVISFDNTHISGKGLDICFYGNEVEKCLIKDRIFSGVSSFILPSYKDAGNLTINIGNQSIGDEETINRLGDITTKYFPYEFIKSIEILPKNVPTYYLNSIKTNSSRKIRSYKYLVDVGESSASKTISKNDSHDGIGVEGLIILNQSYEDGWRIYYRNKCFLDIITPLSCRKVESEHVLVKNWANGWIVDGATNSYVILFWPQYLQFFGNLLFIFTIFTLIVLFILARLHATKRKVRF